MAIESCFLCKDKVEMQYDSEYLILILAQGEWNPPSRLVFHTSCFFDAAGDDYKKGLKYTSKSKESMTSAYERELKIQKELMQQMYAKQMYDMQQKMYDMMGVPKEKLYVEEAKEMVKKTAEYYHDYAGEWSKAPGKSTNKK